MDRSYFFKTSLLFSAAMLLSALKTSPAHAQGGTLRIGPMTLQDNQYVIPVVLDGAENQVTAMNFRVHYDPEVFQPVQAQSGAAAQQADKVVTANSPEPGEYVVVMMGLNQTSVPQGEIARVVMQQVSTPESGRSEIYIADPTLATADGTEIPSRGMSRTVDFADVEQAQAEPGEAPAPANPAAEKPVTPETPAPGSGNPSETPVPELPAGAPSTGVPRVPPRSAEEISRPFPGGAGDGDIDVQALSQQLARAVETAGTLREGLPDVGAAGTEDRTPGAASTGAGVTPKRDLTDAPGSGTILSRQQNLAAMRPIVNASGEPVEGSIAVTLGATGVRPAGKSGMGMLWVVAVAVGVLVSVGLIMVGSKRLGKRRISP